MIDDGDLAGWEMLYDKYAPMIYTILLRRAAGNVPMAEGMLQIVFEGLAENRLLFQETSALPAVLIRYTCDVSFKILKDCKAGSAANRSPSSPFLQALVYDNCPIYQLAASQKISTAAVRQRLRMEIQELRKTP